MKGRENLTQRGFKKTVDWSLVVCYLFLVLFGLVNIYAAVRSSEPSSILDFNYNCGKQALWIASALLLAVLILFVVNPRFWEAITRPAYIAVVVLLVLVIFVSKDVKGSHSWFELGPVKFQPAELSKITTSLLLAACMSKPDFKLSGDNFWRVAGIIGLPMLAILGESETGSALVYVGFIFVLYREGLSGWYLTLIGMVILLFILTLVTSWWLSLIVLTALVGFFCWWQLRQTRMLRARRLVVRNSILAFMAGMLMILGTGIFFNDVLRDHQRKRIEVYLGLKEDFLGVGYNVHQSMIAIGSGGLLGKGYLQGTQTTYGFVPEQSTDFIFCTVGEEWGFLGCLVLILAYAFMIWRILEDAEAAREGFTRIYGYCLASCLFMHLFINVGMTVGLVPVIGIPLPFFSYGGSSLWAFTAMLFIFIALDRQEKKYF